MKYTVKRFSRRESLEDIYKTILNPIILEADKVYGKKSLSISQDFWRMVRLKKVRLY